MSQRKCDQNCRNVECFIALHTFFKRFDTNHDGIVDAGEAKLQAEIRKMKNLAFFVALLAEKTDFHDRGADFEAFQQTMVAWFEELKIVSYVQLKICMLSLQDCSRTGLGKDVYSTQVKNALCNLTEKWRVFYNACGAEK